jgi:hypothetical protein
VKFVSQAFLFFLQKTSEKPLSKKKDFLQNTVEKATKRNIPDKVGFPI